MSPSEKVKILYIEDDMASRKLVRKVLERTEIEFLEAPDGLSGLKTARENQPDLILMDINLPDISGNELTTKIKNTDSLKDIVIVALTAMRDEHAREMTLVAGCDGFISKPIDIQTFPSQLLQFLEGKKEDISETEKEFFRDRYEKSLVDRLTEKVEELETFNKKLEETSSRLKEHTRYLENVLGILTKLQACSGPKDLKKTLVDEICSTFSYDRCAFIDVDVENRVLKVNYALGINPDDWDKYSLPFNNAFFQKLFTEKQVVYVPSRNRVEDPELRKNLKKFEMDEFIFAYLGTPVNPVKASDIREDILPMLDSFIPTLHDQRDSDIDIILEHLQEYLARESLYRGGFVYLDNYRSKRRIAHFEYHFLETLLRTTSYMYQNLLLMEELRSLFVRAEKEAITDPLTNLFNYRYFMHQLNREISRDQRHKARFSLIMIDIDFFKDYNDTFGHQTGDQILRRVARLMMENTRNSDIVARYGGEEFAIICPELGKNGAYQMAEKLRQIIEIYEFPREKDLDTGKLTISLGVATFPEDGEASFQLIRNADQALYKAKDSGRNKVCLS